MEEGEQVLLDSLLDYAEGVALATNAARRGGEVKEGSQLLILEIDPGDAPEWGVGIKMGFEGMVNMRRVEEGM